MIFGKCSECIYFIANTQNSNQTKGDGLTFHKINYNSIVCHIRIRVLFYSSVTSAPPWTSTTTDVSWHIRHISPFYAGKHCSIDFLLPFKSNWFTLTNHCVCPWFTLQGYAEYIFQQYQAVYYLKSRSDNVYSIQHYVIRFVSDFRQFVCFLRVLRFPPPIKLTATP